MALSWNFPNSALETAKERLDAAFGKATLPDFARLDWQGNDLLVQINKGGKSEIRFSLKPEGNGVRVAEVKRDVSMLHKPFVGMVEGFVDKLLTEAGFKRA